MRHSIIQEFNLFAVRVVFIPLSVFLCWILFIISLRTVTAGWRPESNRASFLMMFPTPGMTAWSRRTSHSILPLWHLTASAEREKLNFGEHTSRHSMALTLCSLSSVNLQGEMHLQWRETLEKKIYIYGSCCWKVNCCIFFFEVLQSRMFFFMYSCFSVFVIRQDSKGEVSDSEE